jgi:hypothetical protein
MVGHVKAVHDTIKDHKCNLCDFASSHKMYDSSPLLSKPPDPGNSNASGG